MQISSDANPYPYPHPYSHSNSNRNSTSLAYAVTNRYAGNDASAFTNANANAYSYSYAHADAVADSPASSNTDFNANTRCESDTGTDRFADTINTARSIMAWKQAQDKGSTDARHQGWRGATIPPTWDTYADEGTVGRISGAISWRLLFPLLRSRYRSSELPRKMASRKLVVAQGKL